MCLEHFIEAKSACKYKEETKAILVVRTIKNPLRDGIMNILTNTIDDFISKKFEFRVGPLDLNHSVQNLLTSSSCESETHW